MELKKFKIKTPSGTEFIINGTVEHDPKYGYQITHISSVNGEAVPDNYTLKDLASSQQIENHLKTQK